MMLVTKPKPTNCHVLFLILALFLASVVVFGYLTSSNYGSAGFNFLSSFSYLGSSNPNSPGVGNPIIGSEKGFVSSSTSVRNHADADVGGEGKCKNETDPCSGKYIFIHELPRNFNYDLLDDCKGLSYHMKDMCVYLQNNGFGPPLFANSSSAVGFKAESWFATDQFSLEVIFHQRMKQYQCLTNDSSSANALYVPFYAALEAGRNLEKHNATVSDQVPTELMNYISSLKEWKVMNGRDHFFVAGRISWDFRRAKENDTAWGNKLMYLPQSENVTMLTIEATTWYENEVGIPYPTYFHPSSSEEIRKWQKYVAERKRRYLFAFAGAPRPWQKEKSIRYELIDQCSAATRECTLISCRDMTDKKCQSPLNILKHFGNSIFCLQPSGDSPTRRSTFDSIITGCIPVFFDLKSGPEQYFWHFPRNYSLYSVYVPQEDIKANKTNIKDVLKSIPAEKEAALRLEVIKMIPSVIYANRKTELLLGQTTKDAFDIAVEGILRRVENIKRESISG